MESLVSLLLAFLHASAQSQDRLLRFVGRLIVLMKLAIVWRLISLLHR